MREIFLHDVSFLEKNSLGNKLNTLIQMNGGNPCVGKLLIFEFKFKSGLYPLHLLQAKAFVYI